MTQIFVPAEQLNHPLPAFIVPGASNNTVHDWPMTSEDTIGSSLTWMSSGRRRESIANRIVDGFDRDGFVTKRERQIKETSALNGYVER